MPNRSVHPVIQTTLIISFLPKKVKKCFNPVYNQFNSSSSSSSKEARAPRLNGLNLSLGPSQTLEALGQLAAIKVHAFVGLDGAKRSARTVADEAVGGEGGLLLLVQRAVLLGFLAVGGERVGEGAGGGGGVDLGGVVNL